MISILNEPRYANYEVIAIIKDGLEQTTAYLKQVASSDIGTIEYAENTPKQQKGKK